MPSIVDCNSSFITLLCHKEYKSKLWYSETNIEEYTKTLHYANSFR